MRKETKNITLSALLSSLIVVLIVLGTFVELLDITVAAICSLIVFVIKIECGGKYPFLVFLTSSVLALIFVPMSTATLYFIGFFGYYPILKFVFKKMPKALRKIICVLIFNISMCILMFCFKTIFALQNEPWQIYVALLVTSNIFFICFDYLLDVFIFIYIKKIRPKFKKH
ncbi:MAG: hypothetical protein E7600_04125 [Ruminococcaceae bacterium]|nr:hypothetical protein [Oscillospiraceae bacterium]